nr:shufflon system plasmid conjugative transfer pilus tip adhesin PilV [Pinirhizobacter soli]
MQLRRDGTLEIIGDATISKTKPGKALGVAGSWITGTDRGLALHTATNNGSVDITGPQASSPAHLNVNGNITTKEGSVTVRGQDGIVFDPYGGGWHMDDYDWMRCTNNCGIQTEGDVQAGAITAAKGLKTDGYVQISGDASGERCSPGGMLGFDSRNQELMQCKQGRWSSLGGSAVQLTSVQGSPTTGVNHESTAVCPPGTRAISAGYKSANPSREAPRTLVFGTPYVAENVAYAESVVPGLYVTALCARF